MDTYTLTFHTRLGFITVKADNDYILEVSINDSADISNDNQNINEICREAYMQIKEYLSGRRKIFDLPINFSGSQFQNKVWQHAMNIPYGQIITYSQLAEKIGKPNAFRAVGNALHKNPLLLIVPCHRVNGVDNRLLGYAAGIQIKKYLQEFELANS